MIIALDYDGTYTAHPPLWKAFVYIAKALGIEVLIVTKRYDHEPIEDRPPAMIYYTGRKAKRAFMESQGIRVNIWIDDDPIAIFVDG